MGGKALARVYKLPQLLLHSFSLTLPLEVFWESFTFYGLHGLCFIVEVFKKAICCFEKGFLHNIAIFSWLLVFSKDVTDVIGSNSCGLTLVPGLVKIGCKLCCQSPNFCGT